MTDPAYDAFRTRLESGGDNNAYNARTGALGKHQFLASTWLGLVRHYKPAWADGLTQAQILDKRRDGAVSDQMVALYDRDSTRQLASAGYAATPGNLYLAHHFGATGAAKILGAPDATPMQSLVSARAYRDNPHLHGKTKAQVLAAFARRSGGTSPASAPQAAPHAAMPPSPPQPPAQATVYAPFAFAPSQAAPAASAAPAWTFVPPQAPTAPAPAAHAPVYTLPASMPAATPLPDALPFGATSPAADGPGEPTPLDQLLRLLR